MHIKTSQSIFTKQDLVLAWLYIYLEYRFKCESSILGQWFVQIQCKTELHSIKYVRYSFMSQNTETTCVVKIEKMQIAESKDCTAGF